MAEPVSILPAFDLNRVIRDELFVILIVRLVFERNEHLLPGIAHIEGQHPCCASFLGFEAEKPGSSTDVQQGLSLDRNASEIIVEPSAQVPLSAHHTELRQIHRVIEEAVFEPFDESRLGQERVSFIGCPGVVGNHDCELITRSAPW